MSEQKSIATNTTFKYDSDFLSKLLLKSESYKELVYDYGACVDENAQFYFYNDRLQEKAISLYCNNCPVKAECLQWALISGEEELVWGGLTDAQRRKANKTIRAYIKESFNEIYSFPLSTNKELWNMLLNNLIFYIPSLKHFLEK